MSISDEAQIYVDYYNHLIVHKQIPKYYKKYLTHVLNHKQMVCLAWMYIIDTLLESRYINESDTCYIDKLIINHDDSKFQSDEFVSYAKRFNGPKQKDLAVKANFKEAVKLHKERNMHHYEALKTYQGDKWKYYAIELVCDYIAMGWEFNSYIGEYFEKVKDDLKNNLPENYYSFIESIVSLIKEKSCLTEEPLTEQNIEYIFYFYNNHNNPFEENYSRRKKD